MLSQQSNVIPCNNVVIALSNLRQEWQEAAGGHSLTELNANVGLLLADVAMTLGLSSIEQIQVFGVELAYELQEMLEPVPDKTYAV
jgi:hypothetical protein